MNDNDFNKQQRQLISLIIDFAIRNGNITSDDIINNEPFSSYDISDAFGSKIDSVKKIVDLFNKSLEVSA